MSVFSRGNTRHIPVLSISWIPVCSVFFFSFTLPPQACFPLLFTFLFWLQSGWHASLYFFHDKSHPVAAHWNLLSLRWTNLLLKLDIIRPIEDFERLRNDRSVKRRVSTNRHTISGVSVWAAAACVSQQVCASPGYLCSDNSVILSLCQGRNHTASVKLKPLCCSADWLNELQLLPEYWT